MATVRPFRAFRPPPALARFIASRPYDTVSLEEAKAEAGKNPYSFLHVTRAEVDLPEETHQYDARVYAKANEQLQNLIRDGSLRQDPAPAFYLYAQRMGNHQQFGIAACVSVEEYRDGIIRKHELTRADKEEDRTAHIRATRAQTGPVLLAYRGRQALDGIVNQCKKPAPEMDFTADDGVRHRVWVINDLGTIEAIRKEFEQVDHLTIADGHHRAAAAARVAEEIARSGAPTNDEFGFFLAVLFPDHQLRIMDYNRVVKDLNGMTSDEFLRKLSESFDVRRAAGPAYPKEQGEFRLYLDRRWHILRLRMPPVAGADPVTTLDVSVLQDCILGPLLGITDPRSDSRIDFVGGIRGREELERRVDSGEMRAAFALHPVSIDQLLAVAEAGKIMPPKSTWFEPKLRDGLVINFLSEELRVKS